MERKIKIKEREERRKNLLKGVKVKEEKRKEAVEEIFKDIDLKMKIGEAQK